jgi:vesicle coat complex subunit
MTKRKSTKRQTTIYKTKDRRNNQKLVLFHKMNYNKTPEYLAELIPKTLGTRHTNNTRQIHNIVNIN